VKSFYRKNVVTKERNKHMSDMLTVDFSGWGYREMGEAAELLDAYTDNPVEFLDSSSITVNFNMNSGMVFLSDEEYNVGVMENKKVVQLFSCAQCGYEGTQAYALHDDHDFEKYKGCCSAECAEKNGVEVDNDEDEEKL
jgi:hypothetical protein